MAEYEMYNQPQVCLKRELWLSMLFSAWRTYYK